MRTQAFRLATIPDVLIGQKRPAAEGGEVKNGHLQRRFACQDASLGSASSSHLAIFDLIRLQTITDDTPFWWTRRDSNPHHVGNSHVVPPAFAATFQIWSAGAATKGDETSTPARDLSAWRKALGSNQEDHVVPSAFAALLGVVKGPRRRR